jgi:hypothetical protein
MLSVRGLSWSLALAGLAGVTLTLSFANDNTLCAHRCLTLVALHQMLSVRVALFTDGTTAVFFPAAVADNSRTTKENLLVSTHGINWSRKPQSPILLLSAIEGEPLELTSGKPPFHQ